MIGFIIFLGGFGLIGVDDIIRPWPGIVMGLGLIIGVVENWRYVKN